MTFPFEFNHKREVRHIVQTGGHEFKCPRCEDYVHQFPALSRADNKTEICTECGMQEAMEAWSKGKVNAEWLMVKR